MIIIVGNFRLFIVVIGLYSFYLCLECCYFSFKILFLQIKTIDLLLQIVFFFLKSAASLEAVFFLILFETYYVSEEMLTFEVLNVII